MTQITVLSSMAMRPILAELAAQYRASGEGGVDLVSVGGVDAQRRLRAGDAFDATFLARDALLALERDGVVERGSIRDFAHSPAAVAVPVGGRRPNSTDLADLRPFVLETARVGLSTGPSGVAVRSMLALWGYGRADHAILEAPPGVPVAQLLTEGRADLGFQQMSELLGRDDITLVGAVPTSLLPMTVFSMAVCRSAEADAGSIARFLNFAAEKARQPHLARHGMVIPPQN